MAFEFDFTFPLLHGLHARPASVLQETAAAHLPSVSLINRRNGAVANAKSVLSLVAADVRLADPCTLVVEDDNGRPAFDAMVAFISDVFPGCDEPLPDVETSSSEGVLVPRILFNLSVHFHRGRAVSPGLGEGLAVVVGSGALPSGIPKQSAGSEAEIRLVSSAIAEVSDQIAARLANGANATEQAILKAHIAIVRDPEFLDTVTGAIQKEGLSAGGAIALAERHYAAMLGASESAYLRERALDVRDVSGQLLRAAYPDAVDDAGPALTEPGVVVADDLTPSEFLALDRSLLRGLVMSDGGATSHTVILARAFGVPCVTGVRDATTVLPTGLPLLVDARRGIVIPNPTPPVQRYYALERDRDNRRAESLTRFITADSHTADGKPLQVAANVATPEEATSAFANGAEGIGLFRTEMLFMDRETPPDEEEQFRAYADVVRAAGDKTVIIRTLDIGGDKPVPYLKLPHEENPFLGYRAIRFYTEFSGLLKSQLRAILRAAALGNVHVMFPMVSCVEEVRAAKSLLADAKAELVAAGAKHRDVKVGIMVEVPSVAFIIPQLSAEVSFFSIGTNDLTQYTLAVDRGNRKVAGLYSNLHPAFLATLKKIVDDAHTQRRWVGMCGEMGGMERFAPLLVGLGLDEISMGGPGVPAMKAAVAACDSADCVKLVEKCVAQSTVKEVEGVLGDFAASAREAGIVGEDITILTSSAQSREEAIKELVDCLYLAGRVSNPDTVEEAIWLREDVFSTGIGHGFAIPHCKSPDVTANSVGVLRLKDPIDWKKTLDDEPVRILLMLAIRESDHADEHLKIFAKLARKIMHEEFRQRLLSEEDPAALVAFIEESIN